MSTSWISQRNKDLLKKGDMQLPQQFKENKKKIITKKCVPE